MRNLSLALLTGTMLAGCAAPFAERTVYDRTVHNAAGTIAVSDAKLYSREALIAERRADLDWIDTLIEGSKTVTFGPSISRETEQVTAFAAAAGLNFDPAAGQNFSRNSELADTQQEVDLLRLRMEIARLENDLKLFQATPPTEIAEASGDGITSNEVSSPSSVTAADQLEAAIKSLNDRISDSFGSNGGRPATVPNHPTDPYDDFRDRSAYRAMLRSARNAASLDELHDRNGSQLLRLNFQATVFPDPNYLPSLGIVQMKIINPKMDILQQFAIWIEDLNLDEDYRLNSTQPYQNNFKPDNPAQRLSLDEAKRQNLKAINHEFKEVDLLGAKLVVPKHADVEQHTDIIDELSRGGNDNQWLQGQLGYYSSPVVIRETCTGHPSDNSLFIGQGAASTELKSNIETFQKMRLLDQEAWLTTLLDKTAPDGSGTSSKSHYDLNIGTLKMLRASIFAQANYLGLAGECKALLDPNLDFEPSSILAQYLDYFDQEGSGARIYEIGPREQVQRVSTVARAANSLALAASIAASDPGSGLGGSGSASYSRQALGRAAGIERTPSVVGYAVSGKQVTRGSADHHDHNGDERNTFGWVIGPSPAMDPKGKILLEQGLRTYDLAVDISAPSWWSNLELEVETAWGPSPRAFTTGSLEGESSTTTSRISIPIARKEDNMWVFASLLTKNMPNSPRVSRVSGGPLSECRPTTLLIEGTNLWRVQSALVFDQVIGQNKITIAPNMRGLFVEIPKISNTLSKDRSLSDESLALLSPAGTVLVDLPEKGVSYETQTDTIKCASSAKPKDPNAVDVAIIASTNQLTHTTGIALTFGLKGKNLDKLPDDILIGHYKGKISAKSATSAAATFSKLALAGVGKGSTYDISVTTKAGVKKLGKITFK